MSGKSKWSWIVSEEADKFPGTYNLRAQAKCNRLGLIFNLWCHIGEEQDFVAERIVRSCDFHTFLETLRKLLWMQQGKKKRNFAT